MRPPFLGAFLLPVSLFRKLSLKILAIMGNAFQKKKILVIDDEEDLLESITDLLEAEDYAVITASDGSQGLFKIQNQTFDAIITDLSMPKLNGVGFINTIRNNQEYAHTPVVVLSGNIDDFKREVDKLPHIYLFEKPFNPTDLRSILRKVLSRSERVLKLERALTQKVIESALCCIRPLLERVVDADSVIEGDQKFGSGPYVFDSSICTYQNLQVNSVDSNFYFSSEASLAVKIGSMFGQRGKFGDVGDENQALHGHFFFARALSYQIAKDLRGKGASVMVGVPNSAGNLRHGVRNLIEKSFRYVEIDFQVGDSKFKFIYKYN